MKTLSSPIKLIKDAFDIFFEKDNFKYFVKIYMLLIPFQLFFLYQNYFVSMQSKALNVTNSYDIIARYPLFLAAVVIVNLAFLFVSFGVELAGIKAVSGVVTKAAPTPSELWEYVKRHLLTFALLALVLGLIQLGGLILLIIPGIIFTVWYNFSKFIFVEKDLPVSQSLKASKAMVSGRFWKVLGRLLVFTVFVLLFQTFFALIPYGLGQLAAPLFGALLVLPTFLLFKELSG